MIVGRFRSWTLRSLLLIVAVVAGLVAIPAHRARQQGKAIAVILNAGGTAHYDYELDADGNAIADAVSPVPKWLGRQGIDLFCNVVSVQLHENPKLTPDSLRAVADTVDTLPRLRRLNFYKVPFTENDFGSMQPLSDLTRLTLHTCNLKDEWLAYLPKGLEHLNCNYTALGDAGLGMLADQQHLTELSLIDTKVTDAGLVHLKGLPLQDLDLARTTITDLGLDRLAQVPTLTRLLIYGGPQVSDEAVNKLKSSIPGLSVSR